MTLLANIKAGVNITGKSIKRLDSNSLYVFEEQLRAYRNNPFELIEQPMLSFQLFKNEYVDITEKTYSYDVVEYTGRAKKTKGRSKDVPMVSLSKKNFKVPILILESAISYDTYEILVDKKTTDNIVQRLIDAATRANYREMNKIAFFGDVEEGVLGLLNNPYIEKDTLKNGVNWEDYTQADTTKIFDDVQDAYMSINNAVAGNDVLVPNTLLLSKLLYAKIATTPMNTVNGMTVKSYIEEIMQVRCIGASELNGAFEGKDGFVMFNNSDEYVYRLLGNESSIFSIGNPSFFNNLYTHICSSTCGGLVITQPKAFAIRTNV